MSPWFYFDENGTHEFMQFEPTVEAELEIREWCTANGVTIVADSSTCWFGMKRTAALLASTNDNTVAMLFKLTWGGVQVDADGYEKKRDYVALNRWQ